MSELNSTNWKIIVGGILIFVGVAQFLKIFIDYKYLYALPELIGIAFLFAGIICLGFYLVKTGRKQSRGL